MLTFLAFLNFYGTTSHLPTTVAATHALELGQGTESGTNTAPKSLLTLCSPGCSFRASSSSASRTAAEPKTFTHLALYLGNPQGWWGTLSPDRIRGG